MNVRHCFDLASCLKIIKRVPSLSRVFHWHKFRHRSEWVCALEGTSVLSVSIKNPLQNKNKRRISQFAPRPARIIKLDTGFIRVGSLSPLYIRHR